MIQLSALTHSYGWNDTAGRYIDLTTGRFVSRSLIARELGRVVDYSGANMTALTEQLTADAITLPEWQIGMEREIKAVHAASAAAAKGGWDKMTPSDWGWVGSQVKKQYQYLDNFAAQIASGQQPLNGRALARANLYAQAGRGTYEEMRRRMARARGKAEERRNLGPAEHCAGCVAEAERGWQPIGTLAPIGSKECVTNCRCYFTYR